MRKSSSDPPGLRNMTSACPRLCGTQAKTLYCPQLLHLSPGRKVKVLLKSY